MSDYFVVWWDSAVLSHCCRRPCSWEKFEIQNNRDLLSWHDYADDDGDDLHQLFKTQFLFV